MVKVSEVQEVIFPVTIRLFLCFGKRPKKGRNAQREDLSFFKKSIKRSEISRSLRAPKAKPQRRVLAVSGVFFNENTTTVGTRITKDSVHYVGCVADRFPDIPAKPPDLMS